jgi:hypothetical protein
MTDGRICLQTLRDESWATRPALLRTLSVSMRPTTIVTRIVRQIDLSGLDTRTTGQS